MYHNFFIHSSIGGHLGCYYVLAIVNSAARNNGIHVSFSILVSSGYMPGSGKFLKILGIKPLYDPAILGICPEETKIEKDTCIPLFIVALFTIARTWK